jgi:uncharacterized SAM-binding protein YcdF (DUF218 family)
VIRLVVKGVAAVVGLAMLYVVFTFVQVWWASSRDDTSPASAIIVLGAAQWDGKPSPVLKARLDHAVDLYQQKVAPTIIVTGGKQAGDKVGEGLAGYSYLKEHGVPESAIKVESGGTNTYEELLASENILDNAKLGRSVVLVSSPYHAFRADAIASEVGLSAHFSPAADSSSPNDLARETAAVSLGRLISYRRLDNLE